MIATVCLFQLKSGRTSAPGFICAACGHRGSGTFMQQHLPFLRLHTLTKLPHCKLSPPHLRWLLAAPACGRIDSNISAADSMTISIRMIWLPSPPIGSLNLRDQDTSDSPSHRPACHSKGDVTSNEKSSSVHVVLKSPFALEKFK